MKNCKIHGLLNEIDIIYEKSKKSKNGIQTRCRLCKLEKDRRWKINNKEQHILSSIKWKKENKEHYLEWSKNDRKNNPEKYKRYSQNFIKKHGVEKVRRSEVLRFHKLTKDKHDEMIKNQNNLCLICGLKESRAGRTKGTITPLCIDHCHKCEEVGNHVIRGLLCHSCNTALGKFKDNRDLLLKAVEYLDSHICIK